MRYNKAVRDNIPEIIHESRKEVKYRTCSNQEFEEYLNRKLIEELGEYLESNDTMELVDLIEVIYGLIRVKGISESQFNLDREQKLKDKGGFLENKVLLEVNDPNEES